AQFCSAPYPAEILKTAILTTDECHSGIRISGDGGKKRRENMWRIRCINGDRKSTRLNSSHVSISYAVFCLIKKIGESDQQLIGELLRLLIIGLGGGVEVLVGLHVAE